MEEDLAKIALRGEFNAEELDDILRELAKVRATMHPAVPTEPPDSNVSNDDGPDEITYRIRSLVDGGIALWLRSDGFGWLPLTLSADQAAAVRDFMIEHAGRRSRSN